MATPNAYTEWTLDGLPGGGSRVRLTLSVESVDEWLLTKIENAAKRKGLTLIRTLCVGEAYEGQEPS